MNTHRVTLEFNGNIVRDERMTADAAFNMVDARLDAKYGRAGVLRQINELQVGRKLTIKMAVSNLVVRRVA